MMVPSTRFPRTCGDRPHFEKAPARRNPVSPYMRCSATIKVRTRVGGCLREDHTLTRSTISLPALRCARWRSGAACLRPAETSRLRPRAQRRGWGVASTASSPLAAPGGTRLSRTVGGDLHLRKRHRQSVAVIGSRQGRRLPRKRASARFVVVFSDNQGENARAARSTL